MKFSLNTLRFHHMGRKYTAISFSWKNDSVSPLSVDVYYALYDDKLIELYSKLDTLMLHVSYQYPQVTSLE